MLARTSLAATARPPLQTCLDTLDRRQTASPDDQPIDRRQKFHAQRRLEAVDQPSRPLHRLVVRLRVVTAQILFDACPPLQIEPDGVERPGVAETPATMQITPVQSIQEMMETIGIWPVLVGHKLQLQRIVKLKIVNAALQEPCQLLSFEQAAFKAEDQVSSHHLGDHRAGWSQQFYPNLLGIGHIANGWLVDDDIDAVQFPHCGFDLLAHSPPFQAAVATPQRGDRNRPNPLLLDETPKVFQALGHPFDLGRMSPVFLGREVDDPSWVGQGWVHGHEHPADLNFARLASRRVSLVIFGVGVFELESNPFAHDAHRIDGVHHGIGIGIEKITLDEADHQKYHPGFTAVGSSSPRAAIICFNSASTVES